MLFCFGNGIKDVAVLLLLLVLVGVPFFVAAPLKSEMGLERERERTKLKLLSFVAFSKYVMGITRTESVPNFGRRS